ncbi:LysR family transcriptional regulator [Pseudoroseomonas wenyumeiae]|uniref:LysR family transcriptional regulator n=1 Tax=Teichococcus wenyumeiae TaxID=2478470 RepID=A0A3A9JAX3_9PROT|nr:LysR family transcriptional regulator [Pseudoroseomonas wenyumeiae]RKK02661.1 LysR family transcriptional regulator [Pseudoroseomonas wenyumeiae]RMI15597.1 LysR family transcriptional regulator [Pseudoroseomonas wenyumeiae]
MAALPAGLLNETSILSLRCFVAVVETQSFSSAARQLRVSPSSVTKQVQGLELALGVALVHRTTRRLSVTESGERFYQTCQAILTQVDQVAAAVGAERELSGHLRVATPPSFAATMLGPRLPEFFRLNPGLTVDIMVSSAMPDLIRDRIDVAITLQEEPASKLAHFRLADSPCALCAAPAYLDRAGTPLVPEDLYQHDCLFSRFSQLAEPWMLYDGTHWLAIATRSRLLSDNGDLLRQTCLAGGGIGNFYRFHVEEDLQAGRLVMVLPSYPVRPKSAYAVVPHRLIIRPQARAFIDFVRRLTAEVAAG